MEIEDVAFRSGDSSLCPSLCLSNTEITCCLTEFFMVDFCTDSCDLSPRPNPVEMVEAQVDMTKERKIQRQKRERSKINITKNKKGI